MEVDLVGESLKFMVLGMLIVFVFLLLMVQVMKLQAKIINKFFSKPEPQIVPSSSSSATSSATEEAHHVAAITAAVAEFRKQS